MESWKDMPGFEDYYEISDEGNARSKERLYRNKQGKLITKHSKKLKPIIGDNGYVRFGLKLPGDDKVYKVLGHRMVALAWIPNPDNLTDVGHSNDVRGDNYKSNLYWTSKSDNILKAVKSGRLTSKPVIEANSKKVIAKNEKAEIVFNSLTEAALFFGKSIAAMHYIMKDSRKCNDYSLQFVNNTNGKVTISSDMVDNSAITSKPVMIVDDAGNSILANSMNSAARKLNRSISSVESAIINNRKCNGFHVYLHTVEFND